MAKQAGRLPPDQYVTDHILRWGIEHPGITAANPQLNLDTYTLTVDGEVEKPVKLGWKDFLALPQTISVSDFHCVEGWSVLDCRWEGVRVRDIEDLVKPHDAAQAVTFECADGYTTSLYRTELEGKDVLLAHRLNGESLEEGYGFPVRLVVPSKYAYKSALWVVALHFTRVKMLGFWEKRGYSDSADVWRNDRFRHEV
ncbi:MAG: molybdopterin-dependent oxidoreductase [Candidatus Bathyarchaeota archaeon]|nr:molybdopterin-dependent oxidoreductase [Candidatus Bathyarchaeota archaeon]